MNADGTVPYPGPDLLVISLSHGTTELHPSWSPDGTQIVFNSGMIAGGRDLVIVNTDGTAPHRITTAPALESAAAWAR